MFAGAHRVAIDGFERQLDLRLEQNTALLIERLERRLADLRADLLKWSFLFWISQLAAIAECSACCPADSVRPLSTTR